MDWLMYAIGLSLALVALATVYVVACAVMIGAVEW